MFLVTIQKSFSAAHKLYNPDMPEEWNNISYGPCANRNWHGHNFDLFVTVKGDMNDSDEVVKRSELEELVTHEVINVVDHKNFNLDVPFMNQKLTSCENIILEFWKLITQKLVEQEFTVELHRLRLYETSRNFVDYYGE